MPEEVAASSIADLFATDIAAAGAADIGAGAIAGAAAPAFDAAGIVGGLSEAEAAGLGLVAPDISTTAGQLALDTFAGGEGAASLGAAGFGTEALAGAPAAAASPTVFNAPLASDVSSLGASTAAFENASATVPSFGSNFSFPSISQVGSGLNIASSIYAMSQAEQMKKLAAMAAARSTPWNSSGGGDLAAQQLLALISGKTDVSTLPGYKAGEQAVQRSMAAQGYTGSGNMAVALQKYGGDFYNQAVSQLAGLSGAQFNPATAAGLNISGNTNAAALNLAALSNINKTIESQPAWRT